MKQPKVVTEKREIKFVPIDLLEFDPKNPRIPSSIDRSSEEAILEYMLSDATIVELMGSIGAQGYFSGEPLLAVPSEHGSGRYTVVEGNRRLTAVKLLCDPSKAPVKKNAVRETSRAAGSKPGSLPVIEFGGRDEILLYLGFKHITGVKPWDSLAKARYLLSLKESWGDRSDEHTFQELAKAIGSRTDYVKRLLTSYSVYRVIEESDFYSIPGLDETTLDFSLLTTALSYRNISRFVGLEDNSDPRVRSLKKLALKELTHWVFERDQEHRTRVGESRDLKLLSAVVANTTALRYFRRGDTLQQAAIYTEQPIQQFRTAIHQAKARLLAAQSNVHLVEKPETGDFEIVREIASIARTLLAALKSKGEDAGEE